MRKNDDGAIGGGGKRGLIVISLLIALALLALSFAPGQAGLRERIEYREAEATALPYVAPTYPAWTPILAYPTPGVCPFWWWCAVE